MVLFEPTDLGEPPPMTMQSISGFAVVVAPKPMHTQPTPAPVIEAPEPIQVLSLAVPVARLPAPKPTKVQSWYVQAALLEFAAWQPIAVRLSEGWRGRLKAS